VGTTRRRASVLRRFTEGERPRVWWNPEDEKNREALPKFKVTINGKEVEVTEGDSVLGAALASGTYVAHLCHHERLGGNDPGMCRLCGVEVDGKIKPSCKTAVAEGMKVVTDSEAVTGQVKKRLEALLSCHPNDCMTCPANGQCEFQDMVRRFEPNTEATGTVEHPVDERGFDELGPYLDTSGTSLQIDFDRCVKCARCVYMCNEVQGMHVLDWVGKGKARRVGIASGLPLSETNCIECGQCTTVCPTGTLFERQEWRDVLAELEGGRKIVVAQTAPATRVAIGETMGMAAGSVATGQMVAALKAVGFHHVFDTNFGADLTIIEEANELVGRLLHAWVGAECENAALPMFTSCCPAWVNYVEKERPDLIPHLSSCKSPQMMVGAVTKNVWAKRMGIDPADVTMVSIMPCIAKKGEAARPEMLTADVARAAGVADEVAEQAVAHVADEAAVAEFKKAIPRDVDYVLTTRELGRLLELKKVPLASLPPAEYDSPMGDQTGAAVIFGNTGGVMEAAARTAYHLVTGKELEDFTLAPMRGFDGIKTASLHLVNEELGLDKEVRVAIANNIGNAQRLLESIKLGDEREIDFIEVMSCSAGCIGGGGQPKTHEREAAWKRMTGLYSLDERAAKRLSHENSDVKQIYEEELGDPNGHRAHELLHTHYQARPPKGSARPQAAEEPPAEE